MAHDPWPCEEADAIVSHVESHCVEPDGGWGQKLPTVLIYPQGYSARLK